MYRQIRPKIFEMNITSGDHHQSSSALASEKADVIVMEKILATSTSRCRFVRVRHPRKISKINTYKVLYNTGAVQRKALKYFSPHVPRK
jgi:hypothetical protein